MPAVKKAAPATPASPVPANAPQTAQKAPQSPAPGGGGALVAQAPTAHAVALPGTWAERLAAQAKDQAAKERPSVSKISLRAGVISYGGQPVKGNVLPVIVMLAAHRNTYYDKPFDPNNIQNPVCFALSVDGDDMEAHENVPDENVPEDDPEKPRPEPSTRSCEGCSMNAWGSDPRPNSRGKACKETRRLVVLPADCVSSAEEVEKAEMAIVDIPVTSGKNYSNFVNALAASASVPPWAAVTNLSAQPDARTQFKVTFTPVQVVQDEEVLEALHKKLEQAERLALLPYDEVSSTESGKMQDGAGVAPKGKTKF